jgi:hypothetical protein
MINFYTYYALPLKHKLLITTIILNNLVMSMVNI